MKLSREKARVILADLHKKWLENPRGATTVESLAAALKMELEDCLEHCGWLVHGGLAEWRGIGGVVAIAPAGVMEAQRSGFVESTEPDRQTVMEAFIKESEGSTRAVVDAHRVAKAVDLPDLRFWAEYDLLVAEGYLRPVAIGGATSVTYEGLEGYGDVE